ncbi:phage tail protein [Bacillus paranthracis]|uniref:phage tail protein n=1 Tax=Bacillus paranthracis TaxID=2026186 RepID=UPI0020B6894D|nr:phage tail protein [Bacillus paranthracis]
MTTGGMRVLPITDINGNTEALTGFKGLKRVRKLNGERTLSFAVVPLESNEHTYGMVQEESRVMFDYETYVIKQVIERKVGNKYIKQCEAIHEFYVDFMGSYMYEEYSGTYSLSQLLDLIFKGTKYKYSSNTYEPGGGGEVLNEKKSVQGFGKSNRLALFYQALERWGASFEFLFDFLAKSKYIYVTSKPGRDRGFQLRYNHNIKAIERNIDSKGLTTYIRGTGKGITAEYRSPNADKFGVIHAEPFSDDRFTVMDNLVEKLKSLVSDVPFVSITVDFIDMRKQGYPSETPNEGDKVYLIYEPIGIDIITNIVDITEDYNMSLELVKTNVTIANSGKSMTSSTLSSMQSNQNMQKTVENVIGSDGKVKDGALSDSFKKANDTLESVSKELEMKEGISAYNVLFKQQQIKFDSKGIRLTRDAGKTWTELIDYNGLNMGGGLSANDIKGGVLSSKDGTLKIDLEKGTVDYYANAASKATSFYHEIDKAKRNVYYWTLGKYIPGDSALCLGTINRDGTTTQSILVEKERGDVYVKSPTLFCEADAKFQKPVIPMETGKNAIGSKDATWGEGYFNHLQATTLNGVDVEALLERISALEAKLVN